MKLIMKIAKHFICASLVVTVLGCSNENSEVYRYLSIVDSSQRTFESDLENKSSAISVVNVMGTVVGKDVATVTGASILFSHQVNSERTLVNNIGTNINEPMDNQITNLELEIDGVRSLWNGNVAFTLTDNSEKNLRRVCGLDEDMTSLPYPSYPTFLGDIDDTGITLTYVYEVNLHNDAHSMKETGVIYLTAVENEACD